MRHIIQIQAQIEWNYLHDADSGCWVGVCPTLKLTVEAETQTDLHHSMSEAMDLLFNELLATGDLDRFLQEHGWSAQTEIPETRDEELCFDVPLNTRRVSAHDLEEMRC
jgi:hypothetical protein